MLTDFLYSSSWGENPCSQVNEAQLASADSSSSEGLRRCLSLGNNKPSCAQVNHQQPPTGLGADQHRRQRRRTHSTAWTAGEKEQANHHHNTKSSGLDMHPTASRRLGSCIVAGPDREEHYESYDPHVEGTPCRKRAVSHNMEDKGPGGSLCLPSCLPSLTRVPKPKVPSRPTQQSPEKI